MAYSPLSGPEAAAHEVIDQLREVNRQLSSTRMDLSYEMSYDSTLRAAIRNVIKDGVKDAVTEALGELTEGETDFIGHVIRRRM